MAQDYSAQIAQMMKENPGSFPDAASAQAWGEKYYGWGPAGGTMPGATPGTTPGTGASSSSSTASTINFMPSAAPGFTAPDRAGVTGTGPTLGGLDAYAGPGNFTYGSFAGPTAGSLPDDPGYQFRLTQGVKALDAGAAARGTLRGGGQQKALTAFGSDLGSQEYEKAFQRALDTYNTNYGTAKDVYSLGKTAADDAYSRGRLERDARYAADTGAYNRDAEERQAAYNAAFANATATYAPTHETWAAQQTAAANNANSNFNRAWDMETYNRTDAYNRWVQEQNNAYRNTVYSGDDAWRRYQSDLQNRQFLATLGNQ